VRIASFNILHGRSLHDGNVDIERFAKAIADLDADILALQEVDRDQDRSWGADLTAVAAEAMGAPEHRFVAALAGTPGMTWMAATGAEQPGSAGYGIALLSRYAVHSWRVIRLPRASFRVPMWLAGPRRFAMICEEPRVAMAAVIESPLGTVTVANTHLSFVPPLTAWQLRRLRGELSAMSGPLLLTGDMNMSGRRPASIIGYRQLCRVLTFPAGRPERQLDHLLLRGQFRSPMRCTAELMPLSDHRALVVDF
jgi:endonuclease/exonuclease/phosphatase family metal-dependent hydrolase